jgi:RHS repeat-associated protein
MGTDRVLLVEDVLQTDNTKVPIGTVYRYQYSNHLGSATVELNDRAEIISYEEYHPYGTSAYRATNSDIEIPPKRYRYTGMERDEESGLGYHKARYYSPQFGLWISPDPKGLADGLCVYSYCHGNPIMGHDTSGTSNLGTNAEKLRLDQQGAVNAARANAQLQPVGVVTQQPIDASGNLLTTRAAGSIVPDEIRISVNPMDPGNVLQLKARHVQSKANASANAMAADLAASIRQTQQDVVRSRASGLVQPNARGQVLVIIADSPKANPQAARALAIEIKEQIRTGQGQAGAQVKAALTANPAVKGVTVTTMADIARARDAANAAAQRLSAPPAPAAPAAAPAPASTSSSTSVSVATSSGSFASIGPGPFVTAAGEFTNNASRTFIPFVSQLEVSFNSVGHELAKQGFAPLAPIAFYAAKAVPVAGAGALTGALAGSQYEEAAKSLGANAAEAKYAGLGGAILTGATVGAVAGSPVGGIGALPGAIIGGTAGAIAYWLTSG